MDFDEDDDISRFVISLNLGTTNTPTARAIALSLEEANKKRDVIEIDDDLEDEEEARFQAQLQQALATSQEQTKPSPPIDDPKTQSTAQQPEPLPQMASTSNFLSERAQMEKERRERQKRLRPDTSFGDRNGDDDDDDERPAQPPAKRQHISFSGVRTGNNFASSSSQRGVEAVQTAPASSTIDQLFWHGELRQTATQHNFAWIYEFFDRSVPVITVAQPDASGAASLKNVLPNWIRTTPFLRDGRGCMHMKFMLLFYKNGRLRVVVSTANLIAYDYRDMENTTWLQDVPLRAKPIRRDPKAPQDFPTVLQGMLHSVNVQPALRTMMNDNHPDLPLKSIDELRMRWDWSKVKVHLVPSIAGKHEGWPNVIKTGHPRLMQVVRSMGLRSGKGKGSKEIGLECQVCGLIVHVKNQT
ncbi:hypothetical protein C0991_007011 [Blastosporella zonata]|nr:hypothetical protein C0991_007011 [Blastosporella zonata]